jgi:STIP1 family protein 1
MDAVGPVTAYALEMSGFRTADDVRAASPEEFDARVSAAIGRMASDGAARHTAWDKLAQRCIAVRERIVSAEAEPIVPEEMLCPISWDWLRDPVATPSGHTFERKHVTRWIQETGTDPVTRQGLDVGQLVPNIALSKIVAVFRKRFLSASRVMYPLYTTSPK